MARDRTRAAQELPLEHAVDVKIGLERFHERFDFFVQVMNVDEHGIDSMLLQESQPNCQKRSTVDGDETLWGRARQRQQPASLTRG
jgi:hypothetical protein